VVLVALLLLLLLATSPFAGLAKGCQAHANLKQNTYNKKKGNK
jgi:hypothetical protein